MSNGENEVDVNEAFERLLFAEELAKDTGYTEGYEAGRSRLINGYHLGYHRASIVAAQLGFYAGVIEQRLAGCEKPQAKLESLGRELLEDVYGFPRRNDQNVDIERTLESIRSKYARFCSLARINSAYPEAEKLDF